MALFGKKKEKEGEGEVVSRDKVQEEYKKALKKGKWDKALEEAKKFTEAEPNDMDVQLMLGDLYLKTGKPEKAIEVYSQVEDRYSREGVLRKAIAVNKMISSIDQSLEEPRKRLIHLNAKLGLSRISLFSDLNEEEFAEIIKKTSIKKFPPGHYIVKEGERGDSFYLVCNGKVNVEKGDRVVASLEKDDFFGEGALLTGEPRTASVVTVGAAEVLELKKSDLDEVIKKFPQIGEVIARSHEKRQ